jgi:hypothetical protein
MKYVILIVFLPIFPYRLFSQIINIEDKRLGFEEEGWKGNIDLNIRFTSNVTSIWQITNRVGIQYKHKRNTHLILSDLNIVRTPNQDYINYGYLHYRYSYILQENPNIYLEGFTQTQYNTVQKIKSRTLVGGGLKFKILGNDSINLNTGWTFFYEYEEVTTPEFSSVVRNSNFVSFNWSISKAWDLKTIIYYQPDIADFRDFRITNETSVSHRITEHISVVGNLSFLYDSRPPAGVPVNILNSSLLLRYKF